MAGPASLVRWPYRDLRRVIQRLYSDSASAASQPLPESFGTYCQPGRQLWPHALQWLDAPGKLDELYLAGNPYEPTCPQRLAGMGGSLPPAAPHFSPG